MPKAAATPTAETRKTDDVVVQVVGRAVAAKPVDTRRPGSITRDIFGSI